MSSPSRPPFNRALPPPAELRPAEHLWREGLASAQGRMHESVAVLIERSLGLRAYFADAARYLGREFRCVPFDRAQVTLAGIDDHHIEWTPGPFSVGSCEVSKVAVTGHSIHLLPDQKPFAQIAAAFHLPAAEQPYGIEIAYPLNVIPSARVKEILSDLGRTLLERGSLTVSWAHVERQQRPTREPFGYLRLDGQRGS